MKRIICTKGKEVKTLEKSEEEILDWIWVAMEKGVAFHTEFEIFGDGRILVGKYLEDGIEYVFKIPNIGEK